MDKLMVVAMAIAAGHFDRAKELGERWTDQFEESGLYAAQDWDEYVTDAKRVIEALRTYNEPSDVG